MLDDDRVARASVAKNTDVVAELVADRVAETTGEDHGEAVCCPRRGPQGTRGRPGTSGGWSPAKKRGVASRAADREHRPAVWLAGETLVIDWGTLPSGMHVFCAVLAWSRVRFVRFARDETAATTLAFLAECFESLGGVPGEGARRSDGMPERRCRRRTW